jgi:hypothetical protein
MKRSSLQYRVSKFTPKKFYEIDPRVDTTNSDKHSSLLQESITAVKVFTENALEVIFSQLERN